jgi:Ran GTPase-activating protein (RanGAP) involved in mRNA processing and transport
MGDRHLRELLRSGALGGLLSLDLSHNRLRVDGVEVLAQATELGELRALCLERNAIRDEGALCLASAPSLSALRSLDLTSARLTLAGVEALAKLGIELGRTVWL